MMSKVHLTLFRLNNNINNPLVPPPHTAPRLASLKVSGYRLLELSIGLREISQWLQQRPLFPTRAFSHKESILVSKSLLRASL